MISKYFDTVEDLSRAIDYAIGAEKEIKKILKNDPRFTDARMANDRRLKDLRWQKKTFCKEYREIKRDPIIQP